MNSRVTVWKPHVTVAAIVTRGGKYLLVEEETTDGTVINQPAGHLDPGESLIEAAARETLEETAYAFTPKSLVGVYQYRRTRRDATYLRFAFDGELGEREAGRALDTGIVRALWLSADEIRECRSRHRSPLVLTCVEDHLAGRQYPLELLTHLSV